MEREPLQIPFIYICHGAAPICREHNEIVAGHSPRR
jgi:hypothetical protein